MQLRAHGADACIFVLKSDPFPRLNRRKFSILPTFAHGFFLKSLCTIGALTG
jgi:hypothetical protein